MQITIDVTAAAPIDVVWKAWTTPDRITQSNHAVECCFRRMVLPDRDERPALTLIVMGRGIRSYTMRHLKP